MMITKLSTIKRNLCPFRLKHLWQYFSLHPVGIESWSLHTDQPEDNFKQKSESETKIWLYYFHFMRWFIPKVKKLKINVWLFDLTPQINRRYGWRWRFWTGVLLVKGSLSPVGMFNSWVLTFFSSTGIYLSTKIFYCWQLILMLNTLGQVSFGELMTLFSVRDSSTAQLGNGWVESTQWKRKHSRVPLNQMTNIFQIANRLFNQFYKKR